MIRAPQLRMTPSSARIPRGSPCQADIQKAQSRPPAKAPIQACRAQISRVVLKPVASSLEKAARVQIRWAVKRACARSQDARRRGSTSPLYKKAANTALRAFRGTRTRPYWKTAEIWAPRILEPEDLSPAAMEASTIAHQAQFDGFHRSFGTAAGPQRLEDGRHVGADRVQSKPQAVGDFLVGLAQ